MANLKLKENADIKTSNNLSINVLPESGHILPFAGPSNKIPAGWLLCDGTNGTPNLIGQFPGGKSNIAVGATELHTHTFTHNIGAYSSDSGAGTITNFSAVNASNQSANHIHVFNGSVFASAWGDSGPANRASGTQANVISNNHSHGGTLSAPATATNYLTAGNQQNHNHGYNAFTLNATTGNTHTHAISATPTATSQVTVSTATPSVFYVNFIMKE